MTFLYKCIKLSETHNSINYIISKKKLNLNKNMSFNIGEILHPG